MRRASASAAEHQSEIPLRGLGNLSQSLATNLKLARNRSFSGRLDAGRWELPRSFNACFMGSCEQLSEKQRHTRKQRPSCAV